MTSTPWIEQARTANWPVDVSARVEIVSPRQMARELRYQRLVLLWQELRARFGR